MSAHQTPTNSMGTARQNDSLNPKARASSLLLEDLYSLYAKGTCSVLSLESRPTCTINDVGIGLQGSI